MTGERRRHGLVWWVSRWAIPLYRLHLGWLLGRRFLLVTHRGRRTGKQYRTVVLPLGYDPVSQETLVVAGSRSADWYCNLRGTSPVSITIGRREFEPVRRFLSTDEVYHALASGRRERRRQARIQAWFFHWPFPATDDELHRLAAQLGGVAFAPPPPAIAR